MKRILTILFCLVCALTFAQLAGPKYDPSNRSQVPLQATSSTPTQIITSSTSIVLTASTTQVRIIPALTGTTYYMTGSGTAGATNAVPLTVGQITFDDTNAPGATISLSGSGTLLIQQTR